MTARRILLLVPHPDDEVVGCAAAVARARPRRGGVRALPHHRRAPADALWPWQRRSYADRVARRREEALATAAARGIEPLAFAERPSRRLKSALGAALAELRSAIDRVRPDELWVSAWEGGHQDDDVANFLASRLADRVPVMEYAEYNFAGGAVHAQRFPHETGAETVLRLTPQEAAAKRALLALYRSERKNLWHVRTEMESLRPLPRHDHAAPPHPRQALPRALSLGPVPSSPDRRRADKRRAAGTRGFFQVNRRWRGASLSRSRSRVPTMARFHAPKLGEVEFPPRPDGSWQFSLAFDGRAVRVSINVDGESMTARLLDGNGPFLSNAERFDRLARDAICADLEKTKKSTSYFYLSFHVGEFAAAARKRYFGTDRPEAIGVDELLAAGSHRSLLERRAPVPPLQELPAGRGSLRLYDRPRGDRLSARRKFRSSR